jgi:hypothetical protein
LLSTITAAGDGAATARTMASESVRMAETRGDGAKPQAAELT